MSNKLKGIIFTLIGGSLWGFSGVCGQYLFPGKGKYIPNKVRCCCNK